jgi:toxin ParE1/3/4
MLNILRTPQAKQDLLDIGEYIAQHNPAAAFDLLDELEKKFLLLAANSKIGQLCADLVPDLPTDLRQFPAGNYVIFYRPTRDGIVIYRVLHGRRDLPQVLRDEQIDDEAINENGGD